MMRDVGVGGVEEGDALGLGEVVVVRSGSASEVVVRGEVDIAMTPAFDDAIADALASGATELSMDLSEVTFMGSSGLAGLLRSQRLMREGGGRLVLRAPSRAVLDLLEMTRLTERFGLQGEDEREAGPAVEP